MIKDKIQKEVQETFKGKDAFSRDELLTLYRRYEPDLNDNTFAWRVHDLKSRGILRDVRKGVYQLVAAKKTFHPDVESKHRLLVSKILVSFNQANLCTWNTSWLNEFSVHQSAKSLLIVETDPEIKDSVFFFLREELRKQAFLEPDGATFDLYIAGATEPIIVTKRITKSPTQQLNGLIIPRLEKMLVDVFSSENYFPGYQGEELSRMFEYTYAHYELNFSTLFNYSRRRGRERQLQDFLLNFSNLPSKVVTG